VAQFARSDEADPRRWQDRPRQTTLFENIIVQDIYAGRGVGVIDPHGDLSQSLLARLPSWRARDLVYIDPSDNERVVTFNLVASVPRDRIAAVASMVAGAAEHTRCEQMRPLLVVQAPNCALAPTAKPSDVFCD
jgi:hypothetical protein